MLANLPVELLIKVFEDLDAFTLSSCKYVNRSFNDVIKLSSPLQYILELGVAGMEPNPTCTRGLSECLEAIRSYRRDWESLAWSCAGGWREAIGNISHNRGTFILGEVITRDDGDPQFKLRTQRFQPKSKHRRLEERTWSEDRPAVTFGGIDPSQDLLLAMPDEGDIHILSLSTFKPYPDVARPAVRIPVGQDSSVEIDICESRFVASTHLRFTYKYQEPIYVYNWRTGRMLAEIFYPCDDFFLLTEELVACYVTGRGPTDRPSHFAIFRVPEPENPTPSEPIPPMRVPLCTFNLPHPTGGKNWYLTQGRMSGSYRSCPPPKDSSVPFYSSGKRQLLSVWLLPSRTFWRNPDCSLVIPLRTLLNHIPSKLARFTTVFHWDVWGPAGSRLLTGWEAREMSLQFGWKIARLGPLDLSTMPQGTSGEVGITVYDFNPLPLHGPPGTTESGMKVSQGFESEAGGRSKQVVTSPSSCLGSVELKGVQTSLPYRVTSAPFEIRGRATDPAHYEISLGEDGMVVWTHLTLDYVVLTI